MRNADDLTGVVDANGVAIPAAECAQVLHGAIVEESVPCRVACDRSTANDLTRGIDAIGPAIHAAECAQVSDGIRENRARSSAGYGKDEHQN